MVVSGTGAFPVSWKNFLTTLCIVKKIGYIIYWPIPKRRELDIPKICQPQAFQTNRNAFINLWEIMSNLDFQNSIKNFAKEIRPDIEKEPFFNRFMEIYLEEALQSENITKFSQQKITGVTPL